MNWILVGFCKRMNALMKVVFHLNDLIVEIMGRSPTVVNQARKECAPVVEQLLSLLI